MTQLTRQECSKVADALGENLTKLKLNSKQPYKSNDSRTDVIRDAENNIIGKKEINFLYKQKVIEITEYDLDNNVVITEKVKMYDNTQKPVSKSKKAKQKKIRSNLYFHNKMPEDLKEIIINNLPPIYHNLNPQLLTTIANFIYTVLFKPRFKNLKSIGLPLTKTDISNEFSGVVINKVTFYAPKLLLDKENKTSLIPYEELSKISSLIRYETLEKTDKKSLETIGYELIKVTESIFNSLLTLKILCRDHYIQPRHGIPGKPYEYWMSEGYIKRVNGPILQRYSSLIFEDLSIPVIEKESVESIYDQVVTKESSKPEDSILVLRENVTFNEKNFSKKPSNKKRSVKKSKDRESGLKSQVLTHTDLEDVAFNKANHGIQIVPKIGQYILSSGMNIRMLPTNIHQVLSNCANELTDVHEANKSLTSLERMLTSAIYQSSDAKIRVFKPDLVDVKLTGRTFVQQGGAIELLPTSVRKIIFKEMSKHTDLPICNYDLASSHLTCLLQYFFNFYYLKDVPSVNLLYKFIADPTFQLSVYEELNLSRDLVKNLLYRSVNTDNLSASITAWTNGIKNLNLRDRAKLSVAMHMGKNNHLYNLVKDVNNLSKFLSTNIRNEMLKLNDGFISNGVYNVNQSYMPNKKILPSFFTQGMESSFIYALIHMANYYQDFCVLSYEFDGIVTAGPLPEDAVIAARRSSEFHTARLKLKNVWHKGEEITDLSTVTTNTEIYSENYYNSIENYLTGEDK